MQENINKNDLNKDQKTKAKKGMKWATIIIIIVLLFWGGMYIIGGMLGVGQSGSVGTPCVLDSDPSAPGCQGGVYSQSPAQAQRYNPFGLFGGTDNTNSVSDTREFMKTSYSSIFKTRHVKDIAKQATRIIRGFGGRIDGQNLSDTSGYISFVVPKKNFQEMQDELSSLVHKKLYTDSVNNQNLLNQKQTIETNQQNTVSNIQTLEQQKESLVTSHNKKVAQYTTQIKEKEAELVMANNRYASFYNNLNNNATDIERQQALESISSWQTNLSQEIQKLKQNLSNENIQYTNALSNLKNGISLGKDTLTELANQDKNFTENIETVSGYISIEYLTWWQLLKIFSPVHPVFLIIGLWFIIYLIVRKYYTQLNTFFGFK